MKDSINHHKLVFHNFLQIQASASAGMSVVLLTGDAFFPSENIAKIPEGNNDEVTDTLWEDLKDEIDTESETSKQESDIKYVNSIVLEIEVEDQSPDFILNLYIKPNFQVVRFLHRLS